MLLSECFEITKQKIDSSESNIILWPENALTGDICLNDLSSSKAIVSLKKKLQDFPGTTIITGAVVEEIVDSPAEGTYAPNIMFNHDSSYYFKRYNTALRISQNIPAEIKYKERLVPFSESLPTRKIFSPMVSRVSNLAELNFSAADSENPAFSLDHGIRTSPIICYGSAFSSFTANEIRGTKSSFISIVSNEGWMKSKKAFNHFKWFAICRAIENRRFLAKSSNEGISALIDEKGEILESISTIEPGVITAKLQANDEYSFFTLHYKYVYILIMIGGPLLLLLLSLRNFIKSQKNHPVIK